jgi:hypothetical protein
MVFVDVSLWLFLSNKNLSPEPAFEGGKWGDRPQAPLFRLKKTVVHKQEKFLWIMERLNSRAKSRKLI